MISWWSRTSWLWCFIVLLQARGSKVWTLHGILWVANNNHHPCLWWGLVNVGVRPQWSTEMITESPHTARDRHYKWSRRRNTDILWDANKKKWNGEVEEFYTLFVLFFWRGSCDFQLLHKHLQKMNESLSVLAHFLSGGEPSLLEVHIQGRN